MSLSTCFTIALILLGATVANGRLRGRSGRECISTINPEFYDLSFEISRGVMQSGEGTLAIHPQNLRRYNSDRAQSAPEHPCGGPLVDEDNDIHPENDSLCPWDYVRDFNASRIPQVIYKARCLSCNGSCLNPIPDIAGNYSEMPRLFVGCSEIYHRFPVLVRQPGCLGRTGMVKYVQETIKVPVGCACMRLPLSIS